MNGHTTVAAPARHAEPPAIDATAFEAAEEPIDLKRYRAEDWLALAIFFLLGLTVLYQFFTRYALNDSAAWTEEIARYLLIGTVFIGAAIGVRKNNHIQVDFLYRVLPRWFMRPMSLGVDVLRIAFLVTAVVLTWQLIDRIGSSRMAVVDLPMGIVYGSVLLGFVLMTWRALGVARDNLRRGASVLEAPEFADEPEGLP
jgi:TRAP-type C4-dicarboxylate transport system permease small subunit